MQKSKWLYHFELEPLIYIAQLLLALEVGPLRRALVSGSSIQAIGALYAICSLVVVPLTWYRTAYSFSVGYGLSIAAASLALLSSFAFSGGGTIGISQLMTAKGAPTILACTALVYGLRLAAFIYVREHTVEEKRRVFEDMDRKPPLKRTPLALGVSMLYAFMVSPALFAFRGTLSAGSVSERLQVFFTGVAAFGMLLESIADQHKYEVKRQCPKGGKFVGPTTWTYKLCRHPNYLGEILHWAGIFGAGCVSFGTSIVAWVGGVLGLAGILSTMNHNARIVGEFG